MPMTPTVKLPLRELTVRKSCRCKNKNWFKNEGCKSCFNDSVLASIKTVIFSNQFS